MIVLRRVLLTIPNIYCTIGLVSDYFSKLLLNFLREFVLVSAEAPTASLILVGQCNNAQNCGRYLLICIKYLFTYIVINIFPGRGCVCKAGDICAFICSIFDCMMFPLYWES